MFPNPGPGRLIIIEGLDGAGSTTQVCLLEQELSRSRPVYLTHEPSDGPVGLQIRTVLQHRVKVSPAVLAALFAADRVDHLYHRSGREGIVPRLERGVDVINDRYYLSSLAYQGMDLDREWVWNMQARCIRPDVTFFVDVPVQICLERITASRRGHFDLFENRAALTRARQSYLQAIDRRQQEGDRIVVVDGNAPPDQVHDLIWQEVAKLR